MAKKKTKTYTYTLTVHNKRTRKLYEKYLKRKKLIGEQKALIELFTGKRIDWSKLRKVSADKYVLKKKYKNLKEKYYIKPY